MAELECPHPERKQIAPPQVNVKSERVLQVRSWWCKDCGARWSSTDDLGKLGSVSLTIEMAVKDDAGG